ncbi:hypothetical protein TNCT_238891 [Trichonephila clavata]|uniref:Uncharacterized protein n=1 Tax=Trichonephila clavata TaxID=2740835 RepID=A0A8X6J9T9_TRICU|nr:hypothetical protein TNCT_238891 [Trichonephila clavata]
MYGLGIKISLLFLIAFALVKGNEEVENDRNCSNERFLACYEIMPQEMKEADDYPDEGVLDRSCPELRKMTECFESYIDDCVNTGDGSFPSMHTWKFIKEYVTRIPLFEQITCNTLHATENWTVTVHSKNASIMLQPQSRII